MTVYRRGLDGYPRVSLGVAGGLTGGEGGRQDGDGEGISGGVDYIGALGGAPSVAHGLLVVGDGERSAVDEGIDENGVAHAGGGVIVVS